MSSYKRLDDRMNRRILEILEEGQLQMKIARNLLEAPSVMSNLWKQ
ncbi:hypothetical protein AVEN_123311-1, partial [Araneus ventricosus]